MTTQPHPTLGATEHARAGVPALAASLGFVIAYFATELVVSGFATSGLPLPTDPSEAARHWFANNQLAAVLMGVCQAVSVLFLDWFVIVTGTRSSRVWGFAGVALMLLASVCAWLLAMLAPTASLGTVEVLRDANFLTGGTAHVLVLGLFAFLTSREGGFGKGVRVLSAVAVVVCVLSLTSLLVWQAAALILLGRLLCMVWTITAAASMIRRQRPAS